MKISHSINPELRRRKVKVAMIGCGGTGCAVYPKLVQLHGALLALGHPGGLHVTVYDDDSFSEANLWRQTFWPEDVGRNKAVAVVNRHNINCGIEWDAIPKRLNKSDKIYPDIVIGCVDTRKARAAIIGAVGSERAYYIDSGNTSDTGQVILGELGNKLKLKRYDRLPHVADLFPDMINPGLDGLDDQPSCSMAEAILKQSLVINSAMSIEVFNLLWILFREKELPYSGRFVNLTSGLSTPLKLDTDVWARLGYQHPKPTKKEALEIKRQLQPA